MRMLIVGAGALGGYFGGRLLAAGRDVTFLVRPATAERLAAGGLNVLSANGDLHLASPPTVLASALHGTFDLILLTSKAQDLAESMEAFAPAVREGTAILPLLNGMAHMDALTQRFGAEHVFGGVSIISAVRDADGTIRHLNKLDRVIFGDASRAPDQPATAREEAVLAALTGCGFEAKLAANILQEMWNKWVSITTYAGITCMMRAAMGDIHAAGASPIALRLLAECASVAARAGYPATQAALDYAHSVIVEPGSHFTASMLRDLEAGAPVEREHIVGDLLGRAQRYGLETPTLALADAHLRCYEARRARENGV